MAGSLRYRKSWRCEQPFGVIVSARERPALVGALRHLDFCRLLARYWPKYHRFRAEDWCFRESIDCNWFVGDGWLSSRAQQSCVGAGFAHIDRDRRCPRGWKPRDQQCCAETNCAAQEHQLGRRHGWPIKPIKSPAAGRRAPGPRLKGVTLRSG